ncbi:hypothetical protein COCVIDRAFT_109583 [Bipolaris victoriae FI3]|uniref:Rhodopsin domain-containing protein n=2 Tax=Bipolaris TaxID=33194 RepID=W6XMN9_COCC2|nr:uncharacterized protein COCCADRAFT_9105 [Bipolaris zeicola 26-R-13]XP_014552702.1 hypothetical protein COCVIDRAFT_109583 [Bipolaris victoriae FI3]EUC28547.1 hypothetical protein COCCADRAFT_9105 [Bipolaris zeicola 26-R-13]
MTYFEDKAPNLAASIIALAVVAYMTFGLRVYTRIHNQAWGLDDWSMTLATIPFTGLTISCIGGAFSGVGIHDNKLSPSEKVQGMQFFFFFEVFYCAAIIPIKLSISFMLIRIASRRKTYIYSLYAVSAMFVIMNLIALLYIIFQCAPVSYAWDQSTPGGKCNPAQTLADIYYATTAINIATDWFCALLPIPLLWNVQLNRNAKLSVGVILGLGALASLSACIRLIYTVNLTSSTDYLHGVADVILWGYAENGVGMIVGCVATLRPLLQRVLKLGSSGSSATPQTPAAGYAKRPAVKSHLTGRDEEWVALEDGQTVNMVRGQGSVGSEEFILPSKDYRGIHVTSTVEQRTSSLKL